MLRLEVFPEGGDRHHAGGEHNHIHVVKENLVPEKLVKSFHGKFASTRQNFGRLSPDENHALLLGLSEEIFAMAGSAHLLVEDEHIGLRVLLLYLDGLFKSSETAHRRTVRQILRVALTRALNESDCLQGPAVRRSCYFARLCAFLELNVCDDVCRCAVPELLVELFGVIGLPARRHDNRADVMIAGGPVLLNLRVENTGAAGELFNFGAGQDLYLVVVLDRLRSAC